MVWLHLEQGWGVILHPNIWYLLKIIRYLFNLHRMVIWSIFSKFHLHVFTFHPSFSHLILIEIAIETYDFPLHLSTLFPLTFFRHHLFLIISPHKSLKNPCCVYTFRLLRSIPNRLPKSESTLPQFSPLFIYVLSLFPYLKLITHRNQHRTIFSFSIHINTDPYRGDN